MGETILLAKSARSFGEGNMKAGVTLSKIVSTSIALILCSAVLVFALTALGWGAALPAYARAVCTSTASISITSPNPAQGPVGTSVTVTGSGVSDQSFSSNIPCPPLPRGTNVSIGIGTACDSSVTLNPVGSTTIGSTAGSFTDSFHWPTTGTGSTAGPYQVCVTAGSNAPTSVGIFTVTTSSSSSSPSIPSSPGSGAPSSAVNVTGHNIPPLSGTGSVSVTFGYSTATNCNPFNSVGSATSEMVTNGTFTGTFNWPSSASVSVDTSSYKVGDTMTVTGTGFPASTSVTVKLQSSNGKTTTTLGNVTTGTTGAFTQDYTVPAHPTNSVVVIVSYGSGQQATSGSFTVKAKSSSSTSTHAPTPAPTSPPPPTYYPPAGLVATPTPVATATDTPTAVPTDTPTPVPTPTVAPVPTPVPVVAKHNTSPFANLLVGKLPVVIAIGLGP